MPETVINRSVDESGIANAFNYYTRWHVFHDDNPQPTHTCTNKGDALQFAGFLFEAGAGVVRIEKAIEFVDIPS